MFILSSNDDTGKPGDHVARWGEDCNLRLGRDIVKLSPDRETQTTQSGDGEGCDVTPLQIAQIFL